MELYLLPDVVAYHPIIYADEHKSLHAVVNDKSPGKRAKMEAVSLLIHLRVSHLEDNVRIILFSP